MMIKMKPNRNERRRRSGRIFALLLAGALAAGILAGCGKDDSDGWDEEELVDDDGSDLDEDEDDETPALQMEPPQTPPKNVSYEEWKQFDYTKDKLEFDVTTYWGIHTWDGSLPEDNGFKYITNKKLPGKVKITNATAEPVGGEMSLRSDGYVDIRVDTEWSAEGTYRHDDDYSDRMDYVVFFASGEEFCDGYTGTALLNYRDEEDNELQSVGEGVETTMTESNITWNGRTYRLLAGADSRNASWKDNKTEYIAGGYKTTHYFDHYRTLIARVPANYDGLVMALPKDISGACSEILEPNGNALAEKDLYADILTDEVGHKHDPSEYYWFKVSDLVEYFKEHPAE